MGSLKRTQSSKADCAISKGRSTPASEQPSSQNAIGHGLTRGCIAPEVEPAMIEEICAASSIRRAWSIETRRFDTRTAGDLDCGTRGTRWPL
jgi:hypothetical protein